MLYEVITDLALVSIRTGEVVAGGKPSSEVGMHLEMYRNQPVV